MGLQCHTVRRDQRLAQGETSVTCGNFAVREHFKAIFHKLAMQLFREVRVLEGSATQADAV
jgi:hypothetical protein